MLQALLTSRRSPALLAAVIVALIAATLAGVFLVQAAGFAPCELCLEERLPYDAGLILGLATGLVAWRGPRPGAQLGFALLAALFLGSAGFGAYHAGIEWGIWAGPSDCTGAVTRAPTPADFMHQLQTVRVVRCDAAAIRILGLSLAGWNVLVSLAIAAMALAGRNALTLAMGGLRLRPSPRTSAHSS